MLSTSRLRKVFLIFSLVFISKEAIFADEIKIAVASNFTDAINQIIREFESKTEHHVIPAFGSTGKHYAQIINGAPFDAFFAADVKRPLLLEREGIAKPDSRFTYAIGKLVMGCPKKEFPCEKGAVLERPDLNFMAIANPKLAPYGVAAKEFLQSKQLWNKMLPKLIRGENIGQAYQFTVSGNVDVGLIAYSQVKSSKMIFPGTYWLIPESLYTPIRQQVVRLTDKSAVKSFLIFIQSKTSKDIIQRFGYGIP